MRILFVDCSNSTSYERWKETIPVAPRKLLGVLKEKRVDFRFLTFYEFHNLFKKIEEKFDVLMVSGMSSDKENVVFVERKFSERLAKRNSLKIVGGPLASDVEFCLKHFDVACIGGNGEAFLESLVESSFDTSKLSEMENVAYKLDSKRVVKVCEFVDSQPKKVKPYVEVVKHYPSYKVAKVYVEVVRGCSNFGRVKLPSCVGCGNCYSNDPKKRLNCPSKIPPGCGYCSVPSLFGPAKSFDIDYIVEEIKELIRIGVRRIFLSAPDFLDYGRDLLESPLTNPREPGANTKIINRLLKRIWKIEEVRKGGVSVNVENLKACLVNEDIASSLGKFFSGSCVSMGIETGCERHARMIARPSTPKECLHAISKLLENGINVSAYFIYGLPYQDATVAQKTLEIMRKCYEVGVERIILYPFIPLKMSAFSFFPPGNPKEKWNKRLVRLASKLNLKLKKKFVGKTLTYLICEKLEKNRYVAYPFKSGPVAILTSREELFQGDKVVARVDRVSPRAAFGSVISVI